MIYLLQIAARLMRADGMSVSNALQSEQLNFFSAILRTLLQTLALIPQPLLLFWEKEKGRI
jgi:hypothetical protein